jgi:hypothetical protein
MLREKEDIKERGTRDGQLMFVLFNPESSADLLDQYHCKHPVTLGKDWSRLLFRLIIPHCFFG